MFFLVKPSAEPLACYHYDKDTQHFYIVKETTELNSNFETLTYIHFTCFILLTFVNFIDSFDLNAYYSTILGSITVPLYQYCILNSQDILEQTNKQMRGGCYSNQMGGVKYWLTTEIGLFYVNIFILSVYIVEMRLTSDKVSSDHTMAANLKIVKLLADSHNSKDAE